MALGDRFPMIDCHKVLAAYGCLIPRLMSGVFDATRHRAVWPSTGNYCRGGVAISNLLGCRSVAVLPEGMSRERFDWLNRWLSDPNDIHRTPGTESNVKEIYDACHTWRKDPEEPDPQPVRRIRQLHHSPRGHRPGNGAHLRPCERRSGNLKPTRFRFGNGLGWALSRRAIT